MRTSYKALAALALALAALGAQAAEVGRLFFTPAERAELDRRRLAPPPPPPKPVAAAPVAAPAPPPDSVSVSGFVSRSSGRTTAWVNGVPQNDLYRASDARLSVPTGVGRERVTLKVGESYEPATGARRDALRGGSVKVEPKKP